MEIQSSYYHVYISKKMFEIPKDHLQELVDEFASNAKFYMSSDEDGMTTVKICEAIVTELKEKFRFIPLYLVAEAFSRGAKGELGGTTRFTFRNVYTWMRAIEEKNQQLFREEQSRKDNQRRFMEERTFKEGQKRNSLYGAACYWKISIARGISSQEYDRLTLDRIVAKLEQGYSIHDLKPEMI